MAKKIKEYWFLMEHETGLEMFRDQPYLKKCDRFYLADEVDKEILELKGRYLMLKQAHENVTNMWSQLVKKTEERDKAYAEAIKSLDKLYQEYIEDQGSSKPLSKPEMQLEDIVDEIIDILKKHLGKPAEVKK